MNHLMLDFLSLILWFFYILNKWFLEIIFFMNVVAPQSEVAIAILMVIPTFDSFITLYKVCLLSELFFPVCKLTLINMNKTAGLIVTFLPPGHKPFLAFQFLQSSVLYLTWKLYSLILFGFPWWLIHLPLFL